MKLRTGFSLIATMVVLFASSPLAQAQTVTGSGTAGTIVKWLTSSSVGDSAIREDSSGRIGINSSPTANQRLFVFDTSNGSAAAIRGSNSGSGRGVEGASSSGTGVNGTGAIGVSGLSSSTDPGKAAIQGSAFNGALAGRFLGDVSISGTISKAGGSFKIDHPLDPENKYLYHSFVESPDMMNIYNGNITTDAAGEAIVDLPEYFEALNSDYRYQLTVLGTFAQAIVAEKIKGNRFTIKTSAPNIEVSWQVTGVRQDAFARRNRIPIEVEKSPQERGLYLHPAAFDHPLEHGIERAPNLPSAASKRQSVNQ